MNLLILTFFLLTNINFVGGDSPYSEVQEKLFRTQIESYLIEFEENPTSKTSWLIYLLLKENNWNHKIALNLIIENNLSYLKNIISCHDDYDIKNHWSFLHTFIYCLNDPSIVIAYLHDSNFDVHDFDLFYNLLLDANLDEKQTIHFRYLKNNIKPTEYTLDATPHILDFYYFDYIYNSDSVVDHSDMLIKWANNIKSLDNVNDIISFLTTINGLHKTQNESDIFFTSQVLYEYSELPLSQTSLRILRYISFSTFFNGYYQHDVNLNRDLIIPLSKYFDKEEEMKSRLDFGVSLYQIGNTRASLEQLENVYETIDQFSDFRYQSALLNNLGIVYYNTGLFENYIQLILKALEYARIHDDIYSEIHYLNNLHVYHKKIENWNVALEYLEQVNELAVQISDIQWQARVNSSFATYYRDYRNDKSLSLSYLELALKLARQSENYLLHVNLLFEYSYTFMLFNEYENALGKIDLVIKEANKRDDTDTKHIAYINKTNIYFESGNYNKGSQYIDSLHNFNENNLRFKPQVLKDVVVSKNYLLNHQNDKAYEILSKAADESINRARNSSEMQSGQILLETEYNSLFKLLIDNLIKDYHWQEAFYWMDEIKNISTATFYNNPALKSSILSESELIYDFALRNRIERLRSEIRTAESSRRIQLNNSLLEAISEQNVLRRKVLQNIDLEPVNLNRLRRQLGRSDIILYFSKLDNYLFASTITSGTYNITKLEFSEDELTRIDDLVEKLSTDRIPLTELAWFRERVIDEMNIPDRYSNYIIVPDGFLYHIPLEILPIGKVSNDYSYGEATYLIEKASISYTNSLKDLERSFDHSPIQNSSLDFLGFGISHFDDLESQLLPGRSLPPLPLAEKEVSDIASLLTRFSNNSYHLSENSTEAQFRKDAGNSRILHLASHSEVFDNDPLYSLIYLNHDNSTDGSGSSNQDNDGLIYAYELFGMDLSSEMVMLNSCESGSGNYIQGSGIIGFSRAFNYAGVQSLVLNLWSIRDRSAYELSLSFYSYLNDGYGKHEAMRKAKIDYINYTNSNPSSWGSFVVYGNTDPVVRSHNALIAAVIVLILGSLSLLIGWYRLSAVSVKRL